MQRVSTQEKSKKQPRSAGGVRRRHKTSSSEASTPPCATLEEGARVVRPEEIEVTRGGGEGTRVTLEAGTPEPPWHAKAIDGTCNNNNGNNNNADADDNNSADADS